MSIHFFLQSTAAPNVADAASDEPAAAAGVHANSPMVGATSLRRASAAKRRPVTGKRKPPPSSDDEYSNEDLPTLDNDPSTDAPAGQTVAGGADADDADANASDKAGAAPVGVLDNAVTPGATSLQPANAATGLHTPDSTQRKRTADNSVSDPFCGEEPGLDALFGHQELDPYEVAHAFLTDENSPFVLPPGADLTNASHELVKSGHLRFVRIHNLVKSARERHVLFAGVNADMRFHDFLDHVIEKCVVSGWFGNDPPETEALVAMASLKHGYWNQQVERVSRLKLVTTSSVESDVGSVLEHVTESYSDMHPNFLEIRFFKQRKSPRKSGKASSSHQQASSSSASSAKEPRANTSTRKSKKRNGQKAKQTKRKRKRGKEVQAQVSLKFKQF